MPSRPWPAAAIACALAAVIAACPAYADSPAEPGLTARFTVADNCAGDVTVDGRRQPPRHSIVHLSPDPSDDDSVHVNAIVVRGASLSTTLTVSQPCASPSTRKETP